VLVDVVIVVERLLVHSEAADLQTHLGGNQRNFENPSNHPHYTV
jgi:hypothetical protein